MHRKMNDVDDHSFFLLTSWKRLKLMNHYFRHYLVPYAQAKRGRFGKRGTKLHIYMDHIFVAQRVKGGTTCSACLANIPYRLGKQGYVCRNCQCTTHKPCHIKVTEHCENTTLPQMEL